MNIQDCLQILRNVKDAAFATVDEKGVPQVRIVDVMLAENQKIYFCTARGKGFYAQLMRDNHIAVTAVNQDFQMVQIVGNCRKIDGANILDRPHFQRKSKYEQRLSE
ncbi:MAG: pyridoxamine 5'-phosphate oxidase family protein [Acutalibacteraceae bacterium]